MKQETASQLKEQAITYKDKFDKFEKHIKSLTNIRDKLKEKIINLETNVEGLGIDLQKKIK